MRLEICDIRSQKYFSFCTGKPESLAHTLCLEPCILDFRTYYAETSGLWPVIFHKSGPEVACCARFGATDQLSRRDKRATEKVNSIVHRPSAIIDVFLNYFCLLPFAFCLHHVPCTQS